MPKLPDATAMGERPIPRPGTSTVSYRPEDRTSVADIAARAGGIRGAEGQTIAGSGAGLERAGNEIYRAIEIETERIDTLRAEEAFTKLRQAQLDLTLGEKNGFVNVKGGDALDGKFLPTYRERFGAAAKEIEAGLGSERARQKFRSRAGIAGVQFEENVLQHVVREGDRYAQQVYEGTIATEVRQATAEWQNPKAVDASIFRVADAVERQAERAGWSPEMKEAAKQKALGAIHSSVIQQALASGAWEYAKEYFEANKGDVDPGTAKAVHSAIFNQTQKGIQNQYQAAFLEVRNDPAAIDKLILAVGNDATLDDTRKNLLVGRFQGRAESLKAAAEREQMRRERASDRAMAQREREQARTYQQVERVLSDVDANIRAGYPPSPADLEPMLQAAGADPYIRGMVERTIALANATEQFRLAAPREQELMISQAETKLRSNPGSFDRKVLDAWKAINLNQRQEVRDDPVTFAVRQGQVDPMAPAAKPLDLTQPNAMGAQLTARLDLARRVQAVYGAPLKPLTREETVLLNTALGKASPEKRVEYFGQLRQAFGEDAAGYMAVMGQVAPEDPVTAIAGSMSGKGYQQNAALISRGQGYLNPKDGKGKLIQLPPDSEFEREFARKVGDAFSGQQQARAAHAQAVKAAYAALASDRGGETALKTLETDLFDAAFKATLGDTMRWNGRTLVLPYNQSPGQFKDGLKIRLDTMRDQGLIDPVLRDQLQGLPMLNRGDGRYVFMAGDATVVDKAGNPIVINFNRPLPFVPSGMRGASPIAAPGDAYTGALRDEVGAEFGAASP